MTKVFITGDRMMTPMYPLVIMTELLRAAVQGTQVLTGDNDGVEAIVRVIAEDVGMDVQVVPSPRGADGKVDWDARHTALGSDVHVACVHADPHSSNVTKSVLKVVPEDLVSLPMWQSVL